MARSRRRLDERLVADGLAADLATARGLVLAGRVVVGERRVDKAGAAVPDDVPVRLAGMVNRFVSRGGDKLDGALTSLGVDVNGFRCLDVGASTGGFTDCLLQRGAAHVVAVDVGFNLLADKLRRDPRVTVRERTHARDLTLESLHPDQKALGKDRDGEPAAVDLAVMDVSFIGARQLLPAVVPLVRTGGLLLVMVKPQFELPRADVPDGGVVRDDAARWRAVAEVEAAAVLLGCNQIGRCESAVPGPAGNREIFVLFRH